jgi:hypothetical protein
MDPSPGFDIPQVADIIGYEVFLRGRTPDALKAFVKPDK